MAAYAHIFVIPRGKPGRYIKYSGTFWCILSIFRKCDWKPLSFSSAGSACFLTSLRNRPCRESAPGRPWGEWESLLHCFLCCHVVGIGTWPPCPGLSGGGPPADLLGAVGLRESCEQGVPGACVMHGRALLHSPMSFTARPQETRYHHRPFPESPSAAWTGEHWLHSSCLGDPGPLPPTWFARGVGSVLPWS